jgi:hypothetical protein
VPETIASSEIRIAAGSQAANYTDHLGHVWSADQYFSGGEPFSRRYKRILRTQDPQLFLAGREGAEFRYDIPLEAGFYELHLYFAETGYGDDNPEGGGESSRILSISANGTPLLLDFDPLSSAGGSNTADVRVFKNISPANDGKLHLRFTERWTLKGVPFVNGIELIASKSNAIAPIRWVAAETAQLDSSNRLWLPDQFCYGGRLRPTSDPPVRDRDEELYRSERYGNFSYAIPVADGSYTLTLFFSEHWYGIEGLADGPVGRRRFDVYCNGIALLRDFDIAREAGGAVKSVRKTFRGLKPNAQGKLLLSFAPIASYACVNAVEVTDENDR